MRVGPMPIIAADKIIRILRKNGHEAELEMNAEVLTSDERNTNHPRTETPEELCYVTFDDAYLEFVRAELVRLGLIVDAEMVSTGDELEGTDWMCPKCHKAFVEPGACPTHAIPLVTFEDYATGKSGEANKMSPMSMVLIVLIAAAAFYVMSKR
jgi:hypothetical protein